MTTSLNQLIQGARLSSAPAPIWITDGGRACPIDWGDCSQPVFVNEVTGDYDYGDPGGPGYQFCETECPHKLALPEWSEDAIGEELLAWLQDNVNHTD